MLMDATKDSADADTSYDKSSTDAVITRFMPPKLFHQLQSELYAAYSNVAVMREMLDNVRETEQIIKSGGAKHLHLPQHLSLGGFAMPKYDSTEASTLRDSFIVKHTALQQASKQMRSSVDSLSTHIESEHAFFTDFSLKLRQQGCCFEPSKGGLFVDYGFGTVEQVAPTKAILRRSSERDDKGFSLQFLPFPFAPEGVESSMSDGWTLRCRLISMLNNTEEDHVRSSTESFDADVLPHEQLCRASSTLFDAKLYSALLNEIKKKDFGHTVITSNDTIAVPFDRDCVLRIEWSRETQPSSGESLGDLVLNKMRKLFAESILQGQPANSFLSAELGKPEQAVRAARVLQNSLRWIRFIRSLGELEKQLKLISQEWQSNQYLSSSDHHFSWSCHNRRQQVFVRCTLESGVEIKDSVHYRQWTEVEVSQLAQKFKLY